MPDCPPGVFNPGILNLSTPKGFSVLTNENKEHYHSWYVNTRCIQVYLDLLSFWWLCELVVGIDEDIVGDENELDDKCCARMSTPIYNRTAQYIHRTIIQGHKMGMTLLVVVITEASEDGNPTVAGMRPIIHFIAMKNKSDKSTITVLVHT